ncbi:hypothetical protein D3C84_1099620 [compost metagenome]
MADAKPQTVKVLVVAELRNNVAQAVVPTVAAAFLELGDAGRQVEFVVGNQDGIWRDAEKVRQCSNGLAATVHVGGRNQ